MKQSTCCEGVCVIYKVGYMSLVDSGVSVWEGLPTSPPLHNGHTPHQTGHKGVIVPTQELWWGWQTPTIPTYTGAQNGSVMSHPVPTAQIVKNSGLHVTG